MSAVGIMAFFVFVVGHGFGSPDGREREEDCNERQRERGEERDGCVGLQYYDDRCQPSVTPATTVLFRNSTHQAQA